MNPDQIRETIRANLRELARALHHRAEHGLFLYQVSSQLIPFASYPEITIAWWDEFAVDLARIGQFVRRSGLRLEMHPGRFSLLNSPSPETVALSILELAWHVRFFDALQIDASHKLVLRIGATFGDRATSLTRFVSVVNSLPDDWKGRLAIENNDAHFGLADVLHASCRTGLPALISYALPWNKARQNHEVKRLIDQSFESWNSKDGIPIIHLGNSNDPGDRIRIDELEAALGMMPAGIPYDCLIEAAQEEIAVLELIERMTNRVDSPFSNRIDIESRLG